MSKKLSNDTKKQSSVEPVISEKTTNALWIKILLVLFVFVKLFFVFHSKGLVLLSKYWFFIQNDMFY